MSTPAYGAEVRYLTRDQVLAAIAPDRPADKPLGRWSFYRLISAGATVRGYGKPIVLKATQLPGRVLVREDDLAAFLAEMDRARELVRLNRLRKVTGADSAAVQALDGRTQAAKRAMTRAREVVEVAAVRPKRTGRKQPPLPPPIPQSARLKYMGIEVEGTDADVRVGMRMAAEVIGGSLDVVG